MIVPTNAQFVPKGTVNITENGLVDVKAYETANVNVPAPYNPWEYISYVSPPGYFFRNVNLEKDTVIRFRNLTVINNYWLFGATVNEHFTLRFDTPPTNLSSCFYGIEKSTSYSKVTLDADTSTVTNFINFLRNNTVNEIEGVIDFSSATNVDAFNHGQRNQHAQHGILTNFEIRFVPNTLKVSTILWDGTLSYAPAPLWSAASQISIANALNEETSDKSIQGGVVFNRNTILGNSVLDETGTYHLFVEDENGEMTLAEFITNVKGWTIS